MIGINYLAVLVAGVLVFIVSSIYYSPLGFGLLWITLDKTAAENASPPLWKIGAEVLRNLAIAIVLARVLAFLGPGHAWQSGVALGFWAWLCFPALTSIGAVMWQRMPWQLALLHSGDWLIKTLIITIVLGVWR